LDYGRNGVKQEVLRGADSLRGSNATNHHPAAQSLASKTDKNALPGSRQGGFAEHFSLATQFARLQRN
jgi:hypothetical protein